MGVCKVDRECIPCHMFHTEAKGRGSCWIYGRTKEYTEKSKTCACKQCIVMVMCTKSCTELLCQAFDEEVKGELK